MGMCVSVLNDTNQKWTCKLTADDQTLKVAALVGYGVATVIGLFSLLAAFVPLFVGLRPLAGIDPETFVAPAAVAGIPALTFLKVAKVIEIGGAYVATAGGLAGLLIYIQRTLEDTVMHRDFAVLMPKQSHEWTHLTPMLLRKSLCVRSFVLNDTAVRTESVHMRPLVAHIPGKFTYKLSTYINRKNGLNTDDVVVIVKDVGQPGYSAQYLYNTTNSTQIATKKIRS